MRTRIRLAIARLICRRRGHRPQRIATHEVGVFRSLETCQRCKSALDFEQHVGRYPLPRERVQVSS